MTRLLRTFLFLAAAVVLTLPEAARAATSSDPTGLLVSVDLGGGGQVGAGSAYQPASIFELEANVGYTIIAGLTPQVSFVLGMSPGTTFAIRPGLNWYVPETPFYLRLAFDASTQVGYLNWRWVLLGGGAALRITDVFGFMVEGDSGIPMATGVGVPLIVRAGAFARF